MRKFRVDKRSDFLNYSMPPHLRSIRMRLKIGKAGHIQSVQIAVPEPACKKSSLGTRFSTWQPSVIRAEVIREGIGAKWALSSLGTMTAWRM